MYNIVVCCVSALSSNVLVHKMKEAAKENNIRTLIWTVGEGGLDLALADADAVLLAPQVRHLQSKLVEKWGAKKVVACINDTDFGKMDGQKVLLDTIELLKNK